MKLPPKVSRLMPALISAILFALAFPPANMSLMVFAALAPWLAYLRDADEKDARRSGWVFGFVLFLHQMYWLVPFVQKWTGSWIMAAIPWLITAGLAGFFYNWLAWLINRCWAQRRWWAIPLIWAGFEAFRAYMPALAFPWALAAVPLWHIPAFGQHAAFGTVFFVSAWVIIPNLLMADWIWSPKRGSQLKLSPQHAFRTIYIFCGILIASALRYGQVPEGVERTITVGQPGVDMAFSDPAEEAAALDLAANSLMNRAVIQESELLILPEGVIQGAGSLPPPSPFGDYPAMPVLIGGTRIDGDIMYQSAFTYDEEWGYADKTRLVIFGEYVPLRNILPLDGFNLPSGDLTEADTVTTPTVAGMKIGALLCFEGLFPDIVSAHTANGAQVLAVMAIDDWYMGTHAWEQLWMSSVWRSIESGLPVMRSAAQGRSLFTDARGNIRQAATPGDLVALKAKVLVPAESDAFKWRFAFVWLCWLAMLLIAVEAFWLRRKKPADSESESD
jgi:apolipoprotein N-acyltransferase